MSLTSKLKKVKILVHCLDAYSGVIKNLKQKTNYGLLVKDCSQLRAKFNFSRRYPSEASFFTAQCSTPYPPGSQVCHAEGFRLFKQTSAWSRQVSPGTKGL